MHRLLTRARRRAERNSRGQSLVEFALVVPLFMVLLIGIIEFSFALNALLAINFATREAALIAAEAGNAAGADCVILTKVEEAISAPADDGNISEVRIFKADKNGNQLSANVYARSGSTTCTFAGGTTLTVPYSMVGGPGYAEAVRCNVLAGCGSGGVDTIGVRIDYQYSWRTPLSGLLSLSGSGYSLTKANSMRMEPIL